MTTTTLPAAFQDDLSEWIVTLEVRPTIRRWKPPHLRPKPVTKDITVVAPDELTALLLGRTSGYTVLHARSKVEYIAPPTCTECGAGVAASNDSGLCRHCAMKKVAATAPPKHQCIDCGATTKGFGKTNRCGACSFKATISGVQPKQNTGHNGVCVHCRVVPVSVNNRTGYCRSCGPKKDEHLPLPPPVRVVQYCSQCAKELGVTNRTGKCAKCSLAARRKRCTVCNDNTLHWHNTTGVCRACRSNRPDKLCQRCGAKVSPKNKSGKCIRCAQQTRRPHEKPHILIAALKEKVA